ncbi:site-specific tyrosine recombinase/integron integrase [Clostridium cadaveris]|uniref:site-specific tyrosine recombinase/integron integrase n=1 Tax=Clostridium cadaveris TaxID=1529 RepID=UPI0015B472BF|nr:site-specific tyrosine recombinase/integron integrase [Clostridium cadaveris]NWK10398.1 tyrosine-type recombinase/integrase [Clostridium cadaveris]
MNCNEEFVVKAIGKLTLELDLTWEQQIQIREILLISLKDYDVISAEKALITSDLQDKIYLYVKVKKLENYSEQTLKNYLYILLDFASNINKPVSTINKNDLRYYLFQISKDKKPSTMNTKMSILKAFFQWLTDEDYILKNPCRLLKQNKIPKRLRNSLNAEELERLRLACRDVRERALLEFIFATGCRVAEIVNINICDINTVDSTLKVIGKGDKQRIVCFSPKARLHLQNYLVTRTDDNPALFITTKKPFHRLGKRSIERIISDIGTRSGIGKNVYPHLLRHTMATLGLQAGADITTIQHLLGHTTPSTTQIYAEQSLDNIKHEYKQHMVQ